MRNSRWLRLLAYVTGSVNQDLLLRNEYLAVENRILRTKLPARLRLSNPERITLADREAPGAQSARRSRLRCRPDTVLGWYCSTSPQRAGSSYSDEHRKEGCGMAKLVLLVRETRTLLIIDDHRHGQAEHFIRALVAPLHFFGRIGIAAVVRRIIPMRGDFDARPAGEFQRLG